MDELVKEIQHVFESGKDYQICITNLLNETIEWNMDTLSDVRIIHNPDSLYLKFNDGAFYLLPYSSIVTIQFSIKKEKQGGYA